MRARRLGARSQSWNHVLEEQCPDTVTFYGHPWGFVFPTLIGSAVLTFDPCEMGPEHEWDLTFG